MHDCELCKFVTSFVSSKMKIVLFFFVAKKRKIDHQIILIKFRREYYLSTFELIEFLKSALHCLLMDELMFCPRNFDYCPTKAFTGHCHDNFRSNFRTIAELDRVYIRRHPIFRCVANKKLLNAETVFNSSEI